MLATFRGWRAWATVTAERMRTCPVGSRVPAAIALEDASRYAKTQYCSYLTFHRLLLQSWIACITLCMHAIADSGTNSFYFLFVVTLSDHPHAAILMEVYLLKVLLLHGFNIRLPVVKKKSADTFHDTAAFFLCLHPLSLLMATPSHEHKLDVYLYQPQH